MLEAIELSCPWCGERFTSSVDPSAGDSQEYVEDCQVCCQPIVFLVRPGSDGAPASVELRRTVEREARRG